tara:strand:- start:31817 stop:33214 length:1398 start_codon:yes stop_codon:yes gene_type:complete
MPDNLKSISPLDGRYYDHVKELSNYFSEFALFKYRLQVEVEYFIKLNKVIGNKLVDRDKKELRLLYEKFTLKDAEAIKEEEKIVNHDVKVVELFIKKKLGELKKNESKEKDSKNASINNELVHFSLTSEDIDNIAYGLMINEFISDIFLDKLEKLKQNLVKKAVKYKNDAMLARTHGQPASPTTMGKEIAVFLNRLDNQIKELKKIKIKAKLNGTTGNFSAHHTAYPNIDWIGFSKDFISGFGLEPNLVTTQIEAGDSLAVVFDCVKRINNIWIDLCQDMWRYISYDYFTQKIIKQEVGSSTMPHKVNPISFENAEANLMLANSLLGFFSDKLTKSRMQRDLSDKSVKRNIGVSFGHCLLGYNNCINGLDKIEINKDKLLKDLNSNIVVIAEAIQTILRREGYDKPYEKLKELTRGKSLTMNELKKFIQGLDVDEKVKKELLILKPENYIGLASKLVDLAKKECE